MNRMSDITEWMTAVDNSNNVSDVGFARIVSFCDRLNDTRKLTTLTARVASFTTSETPWLVVYCAEHDAAQLGKGMNIDGNLRAARDWKRTIVNDTSLAISVRKNLDIDDNQSEQRPH